MSTNPALRIAIIGAGPRGTSVLERLLAHAASQPETQLEIHIIDPFPPGAGRIWRTEQSRLPLMNTPCLFPTVVPDGALPTPGIAGRTFDQWRESEQGSRSPVARDLLDDEDRAELERLRSQDFPSRKLYGKYLATTFRELLNSEPTNATVTVHAVSAEQIEPGGSARFRVALDDGSTLDVDDVVLALGHLESELRPEQLALAQAAETSGLLYQPPAIPADVDLSGIPAGEPVLLRGLGLNFFDLMILLTEGRGGRFEQFEQDGRRRYRYHPSGAEPVLYGASRRGVPYRAKAILSTYIPRSVQLRFLTAEAVDALQSHGEQLTFRHDLWPLLRRDALWAYYSTLARTTPQAMVGLGDQFLTELDALLSEPPRGDDPKWNERLAELTDQYVVEDWAINPDKLSLPLGRQRYANAAAFDDAVLAHLHADAAGSARGEDDPLKMAIGALNAGRYLLKRVVSDDGITEESWLRELRGWFEPFVEGLASGPPAQRIEQLIALVEAGVVRFIGPDPIFGVDAQTGRFLASSPWVDDDPMTAKVMIEALAPANDVARSVSPLLRSLLDQGLVRPRSMMGSTGVLEVTSGLDVTKPPYRAIASSGHVSEGVYVIGLQLCSVQLGTAIAAQAHGSLETGGRTLADADAIAMHIVRQIADDGTDGDSKDATDDGEHDDVGEHAGRP